MIAYEIRTLGSLPWPAGLGKNTEYPGLEHALNRLLGDRWRDPDVHRHAHETSPEYRAILEHAFTHSPWRAGLSAGVQSATDLARQSPLLAKRTNDTTAWRTWIDELDPDDSNTKEWLLYPAGFARGTYTDGRHRIAYLRLHHDPELPVLVKINYAH